MHIFKLLNMCHFVYLAQLNAWTSETFYKKQSKKTVHYQKN